MGNPLARVIKNHIFNVPARRKRKAAVKPSDIPTLKGYTAAWWIRNGCVSQRGENPHEHVSTH